MESTFYFGQAILNNLGSLLDHLDPQFAMRKIMKDGKEIPLAKDISSSRMEKLLRSQRYSDRYAKRIHSQAVELFKILPAALVYIRKHVFPARDGKLWKGGTIAGPRLTEIANAYSELDVESLEKGRVKGLYQGTFGEIVNNLEGAVQAGEEATFLQINAIFTQIREKIIEDIRHWGDPENTLKQPKQ